VTRVHTLAWTFAVITAAGTTAMMAQSPQDLRFDVVSIRRNTSGAANTSLRPEPNGLTGVNITVRRLLRVAYGVSDFQIVDAPDWFDSEHYDVVGRAAAAIASSQIGPMLKAMLADRFALRVELGTRDVAGFELRVERAAVGLKPAAVPCSIAPGAPPRADQPAPPPCFSSIAGEMTARGVTSELLARQLTAVMQQPVVDRTALSGAVDFELRWQPDLTAVSPDSGAPPLVTALREQLGLRLVPARTPVDVLIVKAAARPQEN
jgi:uncharacterized protein (TIGR03435 family)